MTNNQTLINAMSEPQYIDEWDNLDNIVKEIGLLCAKKGRNKNVVLLYYLKHYTLLNYKYNYINHNLDSDVVSSEVSIHHQNLALDYIKKILFDD